MQALSVAKKQYQFLGRLLASQKPELAREMLTKCLPAETDLTKINNYFLIFCTFQQIQPGEHTGPQYKRVKVDIHRLFIAVILHLYAPYLFQEHWSKAKLPWGLRRGISRALHQDEGNLRNMIQEVITMQKVYDEFRANVNRCVSNMGSTIN